MTAEQYEMHRGLLSGPPARRAAHFFSEVRRVFCGVDAWRRGDLRQFGELVSESGASSIHNYECGSPPLIDLYQRLVASDGVFGARSVVQDSEVVAWRCRPKRGQQRGHSSP